MKKLLTIISCIAVFSFVGYGQTWQQGFMPSKKIDTTNTLTIIDPSTGEIGGENILYRKESKVHMLISRQPTNELKIIIGWEVYRTEWFNVNGVGINSRIVTIYLDENKNKLSDKITVWLTQKIK